MRIALFLPTLCGGGAERVFINLARALQPLVASVDLIVASRVGEYVDQVSDIHTFDLNSRRVANSILPLAKYLRERKPSILMAAMPHANLAAILAKILSGESTRVVVTIHEDILQRWKSASRRERILLRATRLGYRFAHGLISVSTGVLASENNFLGRAMPLQNDVIYNPILAIGEAVLPLRKNINSIDRSKEFNIVSAGRLNIEKDFVTLLRAFSKLHSLNVSRLQIYGEGPMRKELERVSIELGISARVSFPGFVSNLQDYLTQADVFVLSSRWEGFGNVLVEALARGCPVVSTDCPSGPQEILAGGRFGLLTPIQDECALATAIQCALEGTGPEYETEVAIAPYRSEVVAKQYIEFFEKCYGS
jgi:glycosyltransferase involved in cell wall biosynthesis